MIERLEDESQKNYSLYCVYQNMGRNRSLAKVSEQTGISKDGLNLCQVSMIGHIEPKCMIPINNSLCMRVWLKRLKRWVRDKQVIVYR